MKTIKLTDEQLATLNVLNFVDETPKSKFATIVNA